MISSGVGEEGRRNREHPCRMLRSPESEGAVCVTAHQSPPSKVSIVETTGGMFTSASQASQAGQFMLIKLEVPSQPGGLSD